MIRIYKIKKEKLQAVKNILEQEEVAVESAGFTVEEKGKQLEAMKWKINEFKRQGYILRDAKALGIEEECSFLYFDAPPDFFKRNEKILLNAGAEKIAGKEEEKIKDLIEKTEEKASSGIGFIFR